MNTTFFLAQALGLYLVIMGMAVLIHPKNIKDRVLDILAHPGMHLVLAIFTLIFGILMVLAHNVWVWDWSLIVTLLAWLTLLNGLLRLFAPQYMVKLGKRILTKRYTMHIVGVVSLILGVILLIKGFGY